MLIGRLFLIALLLVLVIAAAPAVSPAFAQGGSCLPHGCTVFLAANDQLALAGNNEDWRNPFTKLWFIPAGDGTFGQMYVGFDNYGPQGGMNDQGLFFDGLAVSAAAVVADETDLPDAPPDTLSILLSTCADVPCVVDYLNSHDRTLLVNAQFFFGDANGDAVIVEPRALIRKSDSFLVSTNFYQSITPTAEITCNRYKTAQAMLTEADGAYSVDLFRQILDATHQEGAYPTQYSNVYDLKAKIMYLYLFSDFAHVVTINLADELALGEHAYDIAALFPENVDQAVFQDLSLTSYQSLLRSEGWDSDLDPSGFAAYVGRYAVPASLSSAVGVPYVDITLQDDLLYYDLPGDVALPLPLYPTSPTAFISTSYDFYAPQFTLEFLLDSSGQASGLQLTVDGTPLVFARQP